MAADSALPLSDDGMSGDIPIREGEYGSRVVAVEPGGIEYIAKSERHGRPLDLFWTWNSPNWEFATMFLDGLLIGSARRRPRVTRLIEATPVTEAPPSQTRAHNGSRRRTSARTSQRG